MTESPIMDLATFGQRVARSVLAEHQQRLQELLRPACDILRADGKRRLASSGFGGSPDRPRGLDWPTHHLGPYRFLGQINFAELASPTSALPSAGLLSLFVAEDPDGEFPWGDPGYLHAEYIPSAAAALSPQKPPADVHFGSSVGATFRPTLDLPFDEYQLKGWRLGEEQHEAYDELRNALHQSSDYLLGHPSHRTLAYDPTPGPEWISLLTLHSDEDLEWSWNDGDNLMVFIERDRLAARDFSKLTAVAG